MRDRTSLSPKRKAPGLHAPDASVYRSIKKAKLEDDKKRKIIALKSLEKAKQKNPAAFEPILKQDDLEANHVKGPSSRHNLPARSQRDSKVPGDHAKLKESKSTGASQPETDERHPQQEKEEQRGEKRKHTFQMVRTKQPKQRGTKLKPPAKPEAEAPRVRVGALSGVRKKPTSRLERTKQRADAESEEKRKLREEKEKQFQEWRQKRLEAEKARDSQKKKMFKRNKKGQPLMKYRVETILGKLQQG